MNFWIDNTKWPIIILLFLLPGILLPGCKEDAGDNLKDENLPAMKITDKLNLLNNINKSDPGNFNWLNPPQVFEMNSGKLTVMVPPESDYFNDPESKKITASAPFLFKNIKGDFVATALVTPDFKDIWNACALMVYIDSTYWIKFAFENSDATGKSIVSVVTNGVSDDANGAILDNVDSVWLKMIRKNNNYSMLWSVDGLNFKMSRLSTLPYSESVKLGLEAQCPAGKGAKHTFNFFTIEHRTVENLRTGI